MMKISADNYWVNNKEYCFIRRDAGYPAYISIYCQDEKFVNSMIKQILDDQDKARKYDYMVENALL